MKFVELKSSRTFNKTGANVVIGFSAIAVKLSAASWSWRKSNIDWFDRGMKSAFMTYTLFQRKSYIVAIISRVWLPRDTKLEDRARAVLISNETLSLSEDCNWDNTWPKFWNSWCKSLSSWYELFTCAITRNTVVERLARSCGKERSVMRWAARDEFWIVLLNKTICSLSKCTSSCRSPWHSEQAKKGKVYIRYIHHFTQLYAT